MSRAQTRVQMSADVRLFTDAGVGHAPEFVFQQQVCDLAKRLGWEHYGVPDSRQATIAGWPDRVFWRVADRKVLFVEFKTDDGRLSTAQHSVLGSLSQVAEGNEGMAVLVWRPRDWPTIQKVLAR